MKICDEKNRLSRRYIDGYKKSDSWREKEMKKKRKKEREGGRRQQNDIFM